MKSLSLKLALISLAFGVASVVDASSIAQNSNSGSAPETTVVGYIGDSSCGLKHMSGMDAKECTLMCVKGGARFVLADRDHKVVYRLDNTGQQKARDFAGQKVKVTGRIVGRTIRVTTIEAAD